MMLYRTRFGLAVFLFVLLGAAAGSSAFLAWRYHDAYTRADFQRERLKLTLGGSLFAYGTFRSYDPNAQMVEMEWRNQYDAQGNGSVLRLPLQEDAFIAAQELTERDGRSWLSSTTPITRDALDTLPPGTRLKFLLVTDKDNLVINYLLVGNPL